MNKMMRRDRGYTLTELLVVAWMLLCATGAVGLACVAVHYIRKFW